MVADTAKLKRARHPMPDAIRESIETRGLMAEYHQRPAYQQNDYVGWITGAKRPETRARRPAQMLAELDSGGVYMKMKHPPSSTA
jgi:uncharacterized protein YdeI (YjbR/CyaY-like superfamily)